MNKTLPPQQPTPLRVSVINFLRQRAVMAHAQFCKKQPGSQTLIITLTVPVKMEISINPADIQKLLKLAA